MIKQRHIRYVVSGHATIIERAAILKMTDCLLLIHSGKQAFPYIHYFVYKISNIFSEVEYDYQFSWNCTRFLTDPSVILAPLFTLADALVAIRTYFGYKTFYQVYSSDETTSCPLLCAKFQLKCSVQWCYQYREGGHF